MRRIIAAIRLIGSIVTVLCIALLTIPAVLLPGGRRGIRWRVWLLTAGSRALLWWFNTAVTCDDPAALRRHHGFLVANHLSYVDIAVLGSITPVRFLAKAEVRALPAIGWIAQAIGCVFVERSDPTSRHAARDALARAERYPPVAIFPEGACSFDPQMRPWHVGSLVVAVQEGVAMLPCAILYDPWQAAATIPGERELQTVWRLLTLPRPLRVRVVPLPAVVPAAQDDPHALVAQLSAALQQRIDAGPVAPPAQIREPIVQYPPDDAGA